MSSHRRLAALIVAAFVSSAGAQEPAPATVAEVLKHWATAAGGEKRLVRLQSATFSADSLEEGVAGKVSATVALDGIRRTTRQQGDVREEVCVGPSAWLRDWNGHVRALMGRDLADARTEAMIVSMLYGSGVLRMGDVPAAHLGEDAWRTRITVRFMPKDAAPFEVLIDTATSLPLRFSRRVYDAEVVIEPSQWRTVDGIKVPFVLTTSVADADEGDRIVLSSYVPSRKPLESPLARPQAGPSDVAFKAGRSALEIPFNFENEHLMIDGAVNGRPPLWFMLDTGAESTYINGARLKELGLSSFGSSSIEGGGNATASSYTKVGVLAFPGVEIRNQRDRVIDMTGLEKIYGHPMGGILGYDFFSRFVVRVDYDKQVIDLLDPAGYSYAGAGQSVPFVLEDGHPHVAATITLPSPPSIPADLVVDSGAADTVNLAAPFVEQHNLIERARRSPAGAPSTMPGSEKEFFAQTSVRGRLAGLTLGTLTLKGIPNNLMTAKTGAYASRNFSGTLGQGVLRRFTTIYDYARGVIVLEPNAEFEKPFTGRKTFGATYLSEGPNYTVFRVTGVRKDSPAERAGFKKDDVVTAIDGTPAAELRLADVRRLLTSDGAERRVEVKRGEETLSLGFAVALVSLEDE